MHRIIDLNFKRLDVGNSYNNSNDSIFEHKKSIIIILIISLL